MTPITDFHHRLMPADTVRAVTYHDTNSITRSPSPDIPSCGSSEVAEDFAFSQVSYPSVRDSARVLRDVGDLSEDETERIFNSLEEKGIMTVDQASYAPDSVFEDAGIRPWLVEYFREECRRDELVAEGHGVSAPRM